eukprot:maker-scaffold48_size466083-snap-gene-3.25 protein:Tk05989 transcript:maker-scaffold48_size466083-snap-gene-3.25-mRNA-1 annotation:"sodium potassium calcium exchanger nckx30c isoform x2"
MTYRSRHRLSGSTWKNPERLAQYVAVCLLYFFGLLFFNKFTGLMDTSSPAFQPLPKPPANQVYSSEQVRVFLQRHQAHPIQPSPLFRHLLADVSVTNENGTEAPGGEKDAPPDPFFPTDLFTIEQQRSGAVVLHIIGLIYMFVALAIVCDEFFVPSLDVIIDVIGCSEDVAGATFMAAGGSAPELFTSIIGVFIAFSDVGIGTIVGSAVFNILFVIGMCALFSKTVLHLTWWPLFRDCTFYSISLLTLIYFFIDEKIYLYEAVLQFSIYIVYVVFMKFNMNAERFVKKILYKNKVTRVRSTDHLVPNAGVTGAAMSGVVASDGNRSIPVLHSGTHFRHGLLQLMIHTIDPLHDGKVDEKATQLHAIASLKVLLDATKPQDGLNGNATTGDGVDQTHDSGRASQGTEDEVRIHAALAGGDPPPNDSGANHDEVLPDPLDMSFPRHGLQKQCTYVVLFPIIFCLWLTLPDTRKPSVVEEGEEDNAPLDLSWPGTCRERITYLLFLPIIFVLWVTLPDTRKASARKFFPITFIGSIVWIAVFSYLMVWWATVTGDVFLIPPPVMGLTFLAAGTSIPDLITSVIVARKGFGDMAVSSSVGSNIFDVTVGLPFPWLLFNLVFGKPVSVSATGMVCSIAILFGMLILVFFSILLFNWKMTKAMGLTMFVFYFLFVAVSLGFEYDVYTCRTPF